MLCLQSDPPVNEPQILCNVKVSHINLHILTIAFIICPTTKALVSSTMMGTVSMLMVKTDPKTKAIVHCNIFWYLTCDAEANESSDGCSHRIVLHLNSRK